MNKNLLMKVFANVFMSGFLMMNFAGFSQEAGDEEQIEEVIISAGRIEQNTNDVGRSITVINEKEIQNSVFSTVSDLLSFREGINILGVGQNPGSLQSIYLRGAGVNQTVIMIDGVRINDPSTVNNAVDLSEISLINIRRIEIVRGSHSTLYGSSAIGGVINIITKNKKEKGFHADAGIKVGTFGKSSFELSENAELSYTTEKGFYANAELFNTNIKGIDATIDTVSDPNSSRARDNDNFDKSDISGKLGFNNDQWDVFASYKYTDQRSDLDDGAFTDDDNHTLKYNRTLISYQAAYKPGNSLELKFLGGYTNLIRSVIDDSSTVDLSGTYDHAYAEDNYFGTVLNNELQANYKLKGVDILTGIGRFEDKMSSNSYYLNTAWMYELENNLDSLNLRSSTNTAFIRFALNGVLFSEKMKFINLNFGGRYNKHSTFGNNYTYEINPFIKLGKFFGLYGTYSTGFNTPALYQLYSPSTNYISQIKRGNENLKPESSSTTELGFKFNSEKINVKFSVYNTQIENLIEYVYLWDMSVAINDLGNDWMRDDYRGDTYINIGTENIKGAEFGFRAILHKKITAAANFSMLTGTIHYDPNQNSISNDYHVQLFSTGDFLNKTVDIEGLTRRTNTANLVLNYAVFKNFSVSGDVKYTSGKDDVFYDPTLGPYGALGKTGIDDYTLFGLNMNYQLKDRYFFSLRIDNILNTEYQELIGYTTKGRGIYLKLRYQF